jgi:two-component system sensor histidine kinase YesM
MQRTGWFQTVTGQPNATLILDDLDSYSLLPSRRPLLKVAVCPSPAALANGFEALVVAFRVSFLDTIADYEFAASNEELILVDPHARVILSSSSTRMGTTLEPALLKPAILRRGGITFLVSQAAIPSAGWTLVGITNYSRVARDIDVFAQIARGVLLVLIVLFSVYIEVFFRQVIRPIATVTREMGNVEKGNWEAAVPETGVNEIARLARGFNTMVSEIRRLTEEREQQERERARLELEALRLQISPHFLTNTLNSIRMMAAVSNAEPIRRMTAALMRVVSSSFRGDDRLAPLGEELDTLEQYILIMRMRFGDTFDVSTEIPPEMRGVRVLRMLLQPLVENSILHGLQGLDRRGRIVISGNEERIPEMTDVVVLEVRDNGHGMSEATAAAALNGAPQRHGGMTTIGLYNVHRRVVLNHGNGFGLVVTSEPGVFTSVKLRLPRISGES